MADTALTAQSRRIWEQMKATFLRGKEAFTLSPEQRRHLHRTVLEIDLKLREGREREV